MAISQAMTNSFKVDILSGGHNFNTTNRQLNTNSQDVFKIALYTSSASMGATTAAYSTDNEITGTGYDAAGKTLTVSQVPTNGGSPSTTAYIDFTDISWTTATFTTNGALIYNSTNANKSVAVLAFGSDKSVSAGTFTIQFPTPGTGSSIIQIA